MPTAVLSRTWLSVITLVCLAPLILTGGELEAATESDSGPAFSKAETFNPPFDDRAWRAPRRWHEGEATITVFTPYGDTENPIEAITVQDFLGPRGKSAAPLDGILALKAATLRDCPDTTWNLIRETETDVMAEYEQAGCQEQVESDYPYTITRILKGSSGLHQIVYGTHRTLSEAKRLEWVDRIGHAELMDQVGVAELHRRSYAILPSRAVPIEGGWLAIGAGVEADSSRITPLFGKTFLIKSRYPVQYFLNLINETDTAIWAQVHWYFPHESKDKLSRKSVKVQKLEAGQRWYMKLPKNTLVADQNYPLKITISKDKKQKDILNTAETHLYFPRADVDAFNNDFGDFIPGKGPRPVIFGFPEMPIPRVNIHGTFADAGLRTDIQINLWKEQSKQYRECDHETLSAESIDDETSTVAAGSMAMDGERDRPASGSQIVLREYWWVRSCDATSKYEVILAESWNGRADMIITRIAETDSGA